jgi:N-acetylglutamate synthase-like GNAT family acetyltransferase
VAITVRTATATDVDDILDLLTHYGQPRSAFEPWYRADPTYRPDQSWLVEQDGELIAHLRLYMRTLRMSGIPIPIAGVGNVITAPHARGHGHAHRLLRAALAAATTERIAYSLLWTHIPQLYERHGYGTVPEQVVNAAAQAPDLHATRPATDADLPAIAAAQQRFDARRSGPTIRDLAFWAASRRWLRDEILLTETTSQQKDVAGYIRYRAGTEPTEILELGVEPGDQTIGRNLLGAAGAGPHRRFHAVLPPSLLPLVEPWSPQLVLVRRLMARPLSLDGLATALQQIWPARLSASRRMRASVPIDVGEGPVSLEVTADGVAVTDGGPVGARPLGSGQLSSLILRGCDRFTRQLLGPDVDLGLLSTLAPAQDFVIWPADRF